MYRNNKAVYLSDSTLSLPALIGSGFLMLLTLAIAYMLTLLPSTIGALPLFYPLVLPAPLDTINWGSWFESMKPQWLMLLVIYWAMARPQIMGIFVAWLVGLGLDLLHMGFVGEYALVFSIVCYVTLKLRGRLIHLPVIAQLFFVCVLVGLGQSLVISIQLLMDATPSVGALIGGAISTVLLWPLLALLLPRPLETLR